MDDNDFERFLAKNASMARGYEIAKGGKKEGEAVEDRKSGKKKSCFNCRLKSKCNDFRKMRTGGLGGSVSIGDDSMFICDKWQPFDVTKKEKPLSQKQVKNMLKSAMKGRL
jgi:hypothetical protein